MRTLPEEPSTSEIQPWHSLGGVEHICELHKSCMVLYGIFTEITRLVYKDPDGRLLGTPNVQWNAKGTDIWIDSELRWEDQHPEVRPAIYIQLGQIQRQPYIPGINGKVLGADRFGNRTYTMKVSGSVTFMHVASTSGEACALADNTAYALGRMQDPICKDFCFEDFEYTGRIPLEKLPKEASDKYASGVTFSFSYDDAWIVKEECPILKQIDLINSSEKDMEKTGGRTTVSYDNIFTENKVSGLTR